ncbi:MAG: hypothetical protein NZM02_01460 [Patescibacteria group bacterium]|nr:hypothetical protein [Patescibacteria group bacterium]
MKIKKYLVFIFILIFLLIFIYLFLINKEKKDTKTTDIKPSLEVLPTIDSSVKIDFKSIKKGEAILTISNEPKSTKLIEFELIYKVKNNDLSEGAEEEMIEQGVIGKCYKSDNFWQCGEDNGSGGKKIVLGTCSSGTCRYHNVVGKLKLVLKFSGSYGQKIFENEYQL